MARLSSELILSLIDRVTGPARAIAGQVERMESRIERNNQAISAAQGGLFRAAAAATGFAYALSRPLQAAAEFESAMADVRKVVDFPTPDGLEQMSDDIVEMSKRLPIAATGLAQIAAAAGQAGIAAGDILAFTESAAKIGVAFDISADQAGQAMAELMTGFGMTLDEAVSLTDAMNHLSNAQASSADDILQVVQAVGATATTMGFSAEETAAFASAMLSTGQEANVVATSLRNMGMALTRGESATKRQVAAFDKLGLNASDVAKRMQEDAINTTLDVMDRLAQLPAEMRAATSYDLFGGEARALGPILTRTDLVRDSLGMVAEQAEYAGSAFREFEVRAGTFANSAQIFRNRIEAFSIVLGSALIPRVNELMETLAPVIDGIATWIDANPELTSSIVQATAALLAFRVAVAGLRLLGLVGKGGALWLMASGLRAVGMAAGAVTLMPLGLAAASVAAAGWAVYRNWDRVSAIFRGVGRAIAENMEPRLEALQPMFDRLEPVVDSIATGLGRMWAVIQSIGVGEVLTEEEIAAVEQRAYDMMQRIKAVFDNLPTHLAEIGGRAIDAMIDAMIAKGRTLQLSDFIRIEGDFNPIWRRQGWFDGEDEPEAEPEARARGGPVRPGMPYLVGEEGPEIRAFDRPGHIIPAPQTAALLARALPVARAMPTAGAPGRAAPAPVNLSFGDIVIQGGASVSPDELARRFGAEAAALLRSQFAEPF